jgi:hypothetical protein
MTITKEEFMRFPEQIEKSLKHFNVDIKLVDPIPEILYEHPISIHIPEIATELTDNCMEKGAKNIKISFTLNSMIIEDDVVEKDPEKTLEFLNKVKNSGKKITTKDEERIAAGCAPGGGIGIFQTVKTVRLFDGDLNYFVVDRKIVAKVTWK